MPSTRLNNKPVAKAVAAPILSSEYSFEAIGTNWWIGLYEPITSVDFAALQLAIAERIANFDLTYSRFRSDSWVAKVAQKAGTYHLPADANRLLDWYRQLYDVTDHVMTPLIGQTLADSGYDAQYSLQPKSKLAQTPDWDDVMRIDGEILETCRPVLFDFGAAGKGYLVDLVAQIIEAYGVTSYCVDASGDMYYRATAGPLTIGLEHPTDPHLAIGTVVLESGQALCGSAINRRAWKGYHHVLDPRTSAPTRDVVATWAIADSALQADGLATALFFTSPASLQAIATFSSVRITTAGKVEITKNFNGQLFS